MGTAFLVFSRTSDNISETLFKVAHCSGIAIDAMGR